MTVSDEIMASALKSEIRILHGARNQESEFCV